MNAALFVFFVMMLALASGLSALEAALFLLRERRSGLLRQMAEDAGPSRAGFLNNPSAWMQDLLLLGGAVNLLLAAAGLQIVTVPLSAHGWSPWITAPMMFASGLLAVEFMPHVLAHRSAEVVVRVMLPWFLVLNAVFSPMLKLFQKTGNALVDRITPGRLVRRQGLAAEEIVTLIEMQEEQGQITADDAVILNEVVSLAGLTVKDCMTPRVDLPLMPHDARDEEARRMIEGARLRFVPVFDEKLDAISGLVDTEAWRIAQCPPWQTIACQPVLVPETMNALDAFQRHLSSDGSAVVIVDEYGGFEGLLARSNIIERLISRAAPLQSSVPAIQSIGGGRYLVSGMMRIDELNRELDLDLDEEGMDTVGGLVFTRLGYLPHPGEKISLGKITMKVRRTARNRVQQIELALHEEDGA